MKTITENDGVEEREAPRKFVSKEKVIILILILMFLNLAYLNFAILHGTNIKTIEKIITAPLDLKNIPTNDNFCSSACVSKINALAKDLNKPTFAPTATLTPTPTKAEPVSSGSTSSNSVKEYFIPFGSGSGNSTDWQDVAGLQANVDSSTYGTIKSVVFEASLHIPNGNEIAKIRLFNATDGHPVWNSELDFNGNTSSVFKTSKSIALDTGNKLYKVQMQTQLQYSAVIDQSRLHIITQ
jgi:hypothetical protein